MTFYSYRQQPQQEYILRRIHTIKKGSFASFLYGFLEREKSLELSTSTLARLRSTN